MAKETKAEKIAREKREDRIALRMVRKQQPPKVAIPPIVLSAFAKEPDDDGGLFHQFIPITGILDRFFFIIEEWPEKVKEVEIEITITAPTGPSYVIPAVVRKRLYSESPDIQIDAGTRITVRLLGEEQIKKVWFGGVLRIRPPQADIHKLLTDLEGDGESSHEGN